MTTDQGGLSASEAARLLGVKRETVYAYVSRGLLSSRRVAGRRETLLDPVEVSRLARSQRSGAGRAGRMEVLVDSAITLIDPNGGLWYRGWDVAEAAGSAWFEEVALWLWGIESGEPLALFQPDGQLLARARAAAETAGRLARPLDRYVLALAAASTEDPYRFGREPAAVARRAAQLLALLVESLPLTGNPALGSPPTLSERLWAALSPLLLHDEGAEALNAALVLLADHELATSTLAARLAASTWADIYRVVEAGLAAVGGPLHGSAGDRVASFLRRALDEGVERAVGGQLATGELPPGFGHVIYRHRDPRYRPLIEAVGQAFPGHEALSAATEVEAVLQREQPDAFANVDLALGALVLAGEMVDGAAEAIFAAARTAGWIAHGLEEYGHRLRYRSRAVYTGPEPGSRSPKLLGGEP